MKKYIYCMSKLLNEACLKKGTGLKDLLGLRTDRRTVNVSARFESVQVSKVQVAHPLRAEEARQRVKVQS